MISYLKMLITALVCGVFALLPVPYGAHYAFLADAMYLTKDRNQLTLYFALISVASTAVVLVALHKIYGRALTAPFAKAATPQEKQSKENYLRLLRNLGILLIPAVLVMIPLPNNINLLDLLPALLQKDYLLVTASCCIGSGLFLLISRWYAKRRRNPTSHTTSLRALLRFLFYQLPSYFLPGVSGISVGASNLLLCDVEDTIVVREVLLYYAPLVFLMNVVRVVRCILQGVVLDPVMIAIAVVVSAGASIFVLRLLSRMNLRKTFLFFAIYAVIFGLVIGVYAFI